MAFLNENLIVLEAETQTYINIFPSHQYNFQICYVYTLQVIALENKSLKRTSQLQYIVYQCCHISAE
jgi:hypothetical protein